MNINNSGHTLSINKDFKKLFKSDNLLSYLDSLKKITSKLRLNIDPTYFQYAEQLRNSSNDNKLTLILGAGICKESGLPEWSDILENLYLNILSSNSNNKYILEDKFYKLVKFHLNNNFLRIARYLKSELKSSNFTKHVYQELYKNYKPEQANETLNSVSKAIVNQKFSSIITYNYDDLLERKISDLDNKFKFEVIYRDNIKIKHKGIPIYHVNGYLPYNTKISKRNTITLDESSYHEQYHNQYSWQNLIQLNKLMNETCVFFGTSLIDPNLRRLLDIAKSNNKSPNCHFAIMKKSNYSNLQNDIETLYNIKFTKKEYNSIKEINDFKNAVIESDLSSLNVKVFWIDDYFEDFDAIFNYH